MRWFAAMRPPALCRIRRAAEEGNAADLELGLGLHGLRSAGVDWRGGCQGGRVVCLAGDGSLQMNIQELQTVVPPSSGEDLCPAQRRVSFHPADAASFFGRLMGTGATSGVSFPDMVKVGAAYGFHPFGGEASDLEMLRLNLPAGAEPLRGAAGPGAGVRAEAELADLPDGTIRTPNLEDMYPFLSPEELAENMLVSEPN